MSAIISAIPANALLPVAGALVGWVGHMAWHHAERAHVARGMALIRRFMDGNDGWLDRQRTEFEAAAALPAPWEQVDPDVTGEVLHVEPHQTGELRQLIAQLDATDDDAMDALPAIADQPEHDDEGAPADDTDRPGLHLVLLAVPVALWDRAREWWRSLWAARRERHMVGSGEQATDGDPFAELLAHVEDSATTDAEEREVLDEAWRTAVAAARAESAPRHASDELAQDTGYRGRRWEPGIEHTGVFPIVPAQRDGGDS